MSRVKMNPDGSIDIDGRAHRLVEQGDGRYAVERADDGTRLGVFTLPPPGERGEPRVEAESDAAGALREVAKLLAEPRGILPLQ